MSNATSAVKVNHLPATDTFEVVCEQHGRREEFGSIHQAEGFRRQHEADEAHFHPSTTPARLWIIQVDSGDGQWQNLRQPDGVEYETVKASALVYLGKGYGVRILVSYDHGRTARVFRELDDTDK